MNELHESLISKNNFEPEKGQRELLCSNKDLLRCPFLGEGQILSKDTLDALEGLGDILKSIRERMYNEGYEIVNGTVRKSNVQ
jgi:hypothetical protein